VLITTLAVSLAGYLSGRASIERQIDERLAAVSRETLVASQSYLGARVEELRQMTTSQLQVASITPIERGKLLADYAGAFGSQRYADISIVDLGGYIVASTGAPQLDRNSALIATFANAKRPSMLDLYHFADQSQDDFVAYAPMIDETGKHTGTLVGRLLPAELIAMVRAVPLDRATSLYLTHRGTVLGENKGNAGPAFSEASKMIGSSATPTSDGIDVGLAVTGLTDPQAALVPVRDLAVRSAIVGAIALILAFLAAGWAARRIARPIEAVRAAAHELAAGTIDTQVDVSKLQIREIADLGRSFNTMADALRGLIGGIGSASLAISETARGNLKTAQTLRTGTDEGAIASAQITSAIGELAANSRAIEVDCVELEESSQMGLRELDRLLGEVDSTNSALLQLTETIDRSNEAGRALAEQSVAVARRARDVSKSAQSAQSAADRSGDAVRTLVTDMTSVGQRLVETVERLEHLADATANAITTQVVLINDMAERSKLLALNAGIEAARAGDRGRGFGVIAQELHRLASGSKNAGDSVRDLVGTVVQEAKDLVVNAKSASDLARGAIARAAETGETMDVLVWEIAANTKSASEIGSIAEDQAERTGEIELATGEMRRMAQATAQSAKTVGELSRHVRGAIEVATTVSAQVTRATREQSAAVGVIESGASNIERTNSVVAQAARESAASSQSLQHEIDALASRVDAFVGNRASHGEPTETPTAKPPALARQHFLSVAASL